MLTANTARRLLLTTTTHSSSTRRVFLLNNNTLLSCRRGFAARHHRAKKRANPFKVLGVKESDPYSKVKEAFIKIAMMHHPDTAEVETDEDKEAFREIFIKARMAFESLTEDEHGNTILKEKQEEMKDFDAWFRSETGHDTPFQFMDAETMKEVAEMEDTIGHGLDRDGGMWMLASMVGNAVKNQGDASSILRLESGDVQQEHKNDQIDGVLRRRRRPRR